MPRKKRLSRTRLGYTDAHIFQLCTGFDFFGDAFGDDVKAMKAAWPILKVEVMKLFASRERAGKCWGEMMFEKKTNA